MTETFNSLSVVIPVYNDEEVIDELIRRLVAVCEQIKDTYEIILVNDGSKDASWDRIKKQCSLNRHIIGINLARNFGQQGAIAAGLFETSGDVIVVMDSDLQDPPEYISKLIDAMFEHRCVMAVAQWKTRKDSFFKKTASKTYQCICNKLTSIRRVPRMGGFRAMRRSLIEELKKFTENTSTIIGLIDYIGSNYVCVPLDRDERFAGESGYTISKMFSLAISSILSFSLAPIRFATYSGFGLCALSIIFACYLTIRWFYGGVTPGWTSIIVAMTFLFGLTFAFMGILGEYIGRIFMETKRRPRFVIEEEISQK